MEALEAKEKMDRAAGKSFFSGKKIIREEDLHKKVTFGNDLDPPKSKFPDFIPPSELKKAKEAKNPIKDMIKDLDIGKKELSHNEK